MKNILKTVSLASLLLGTGSSGAMAQRSADSLPLTHRPEVRVTELEINSRQADLFPVVARGGELMIFTSGRSGETGGSGDERIWMAAAGSGGWSHPVEAATALGSAEHAGGAAVTPDGNFMIFAAYGWDGAEGGSGRTDLYSAERIGGSWGNIRNLGVEINSPYWDSQPTLSSDGRVLYFASDRPSGAGGADIYVSHRTGGGWSAPVNLGAPVNTPLGELTPSIAPDDKTLFFSSNGHGGAGGYDIFMASAPEGSGTTWRKVENIGTPVNTLYDEHCFLSLPNTRHGYFASNRNGDFDLYKADPSPRPADAMMVVSGRVLDSRSSVPVGAGITVTDLVSGETIANFRSDDRNGDYYVILKQGGRYSITAEADGYIFYSDEYTAPERAEARELKRDIALQPADGGATRLLVFFDYDKTELKRESIPDLDRATGFLRAHPGTSIEIAGHTDSVGSTSYNQRLSHDRAASVKRYFVSKGIADTRITVRGYGESSAVADNGTEDGRARNRRVEMRVSGRL